MVPARGRRLWQSVPLPLDVARPGVVLLVEGESRFFENGAEVPWSKVEPVRWPTPRRAVKSIAETAHLGRSGTRVDVESRLEAVIAHLHDRQPTTDRVVSQPCWIAYPVTTAGTVVWGWACPDLLVLREGVPVLIEAKSPTSLASARMRAKLDAVRAGVAALGVTYEVHSSLTGAEFEIFRLTQRWDKEPPWFARYVDAVLDAAEGGEDVTVADLLSAAPSAYAGGVVWHLVWKGILCLAWDEPMGMTSPVRRHGRSCASNLAPKCVTTGICGPSTLWHPPA